MYRRITGILLIVLTAGAEVVQACNLSFIETNAAECANAAQGDTPAPEQSVDDPSDADHTRSESDLGSMSPPAAVPERVARSFHDSRTGFGTIRETGQRDLVSFSHVSFARLRIRADACQRAQAAPMSIVANPIRSHAPPTTR